MNTSSIGRVGEDIACKYLRENGYEILKRNYKGLHGEVDIIARKGRHLSFVEVKTRCNRNFGPGSDAVNFLKQKKIINTAQKFLLQYDDYEEVSFDVCEVYTDERSINYIENAFE